MARRGRPSKSGKRYKCGKLATAVSYDHGAEHVQLSRARFARFQDGKATQQVFDTIGRAWAVGLLENDRVDPAVLRDAGRDYAARYVRYWPSVERVANYTQDCRRGGPDARDDDPAGEWFLTLDGILKTAGHSSLQAVQSLCLDTYDLPDDDPPWLGRLIGHKLNASGTPTEADLRWISWAIHGLLTLAEGTRPGRRSLAA